MLTDLCQELRNWFDRNQPKWFGDFKIENGALILREDMSLKNGQYFRIVGSALNDGVYQYGADALVDETFTGSIWAMAVPPSVIALSNDIDNWLTKYSDAVSSPYQSESFGGYTYSKGYSSGANGSNTITWKSVFSDRLSRWRKI